MHKKSKSKKSTKFRFSPRIAYTTFGLIIANSLFFIWEINSGGSENLETLYKLGGLVPQLVFQGEWWRLITANFLHYGWFHLLSNMLGIYVLCPLVESNLGSIRCFIAYCFSGIGAMLLFTFLSSQSENSSQILVGASAAIMGLVGVLLAIYFQDWLNNSSSFSARRLRFVLLIIGIQFIFDQTTPEVSSLSHFLGLIIGLTMGFILR